MSESVEVPLDVGLIADDGTATEKGFSCIPPLLSDGDRTAISAYFSCRRGSPWRPKYETLKLHGRAVLGLVGTQVLWVGSWDILSRESRTYNYDEEDDGWSLLPNTATVRISYLIIGIAMVVMVDSLYSNAGMDTPLNPREGLVPPFMRWWNRQFSSPTQRAVRSGLRAFLAFIGMMLIWVSLFNILDALWEPIPQRDGIYIFVGLLLLLCTQTVYNMANIFPPETEIRRRLRAADSLGSQASLAGCCEYMSECVLREGPSFLRALFSLLAQNMLWVGTFNLSLYFPGAYSQSDLLKRAVLVTFLGILFMILTGSVWYNSFIDFDEPVPETLPKRRTGYMSILFYVRCIVAIFAQLTYINGIWYLVEGCILYNVWWRSLLYVLLGSLMCYGAGTLVTNCCVIPPEFVVFHMPNDMDGISMAYRDTSSSADSVGSTESVATLPEPCNGDINVSVDGMHHKGEPSSDA